MRFSTATRVSILVLVVSVLTASSAMAEPCLMVYPAGPTEYHYSSFEEYVVGPGDPLYDPAYDRGGYVLIDANTDEIAHEVYQAPNLVGFVLDEESQGYFFVGTSTDLSIDGWSNTPTTFTNVTLVFRSLGMGCLPNIMVNGMAPMSAPDGTYYFELGELVVSTPTGMGNNYSDSIEVSVDWSACAEIDIWAFSDEDADHMRDGGECKTAFSKNTTVPLEESSWGSLKGRFE